MSDIRKFFGDPNRGRGSALSAIRNSSTASPSVNQTPVSKKRSPKVTKVDKQITLDEFSESDGESPLPKSVKKATMKAAKRKPVIIESDSEEEHNSQPKAKLLKPTSPDIPRNTRKNKLRISSGSESSLSPKKYKPQAHKKTVSSDDSVLSISDSDEEPITKTKKSIPAGQKKLTLVAGKKNPETKTRVAPSDIKKVSAEDFFSSGGFSKTSEGTRKVNSPTKKTSTGNKEFREKTPPSKQKGKKPGPKPRTPKKLIDEDEFAMKNEATKKIVSRKNEHQEKKKDDIPKKAASSKRKDLASEFLEEETDVVPKKPKISPSTKENRPHEKYEKPKSPVKKSKRPSDTTKEVPTPSTFISGTAQVVRQSDDASYELPWVDKYKPKALNQLVGQHGEKSPMNKLLGWLKDWSKHNLGEGASIKKPKPAPWQQGGDGTAFKAVLLSGTPGVGKTTCAHLACDTLGLKFVEMNASDVRNKKQLDAQVAQLTGSHQIEEYFGRTSTGQHDDNDIHHVLIMDEVDGINGREDRAGIAELIQIIKETKIPIICICNDRSHPKMRSLVNYCFDVRFPKPRVEQIRARIMSIAAQEKVKLDKNELDELIELSGHDVRQTIYNLQMRSSSVSPKIEQKDYTINTFEAARKLLHSGSTWMEKQDMFFVDYSLMPLFVQENYLNMKNKTHSKETSLKCIRAASDLISLGDTVDRCIRTTGFWKLLNEEAMFSSILPSIAIDGHLSSMIQFPSWLGKNSTAGKRQRLMRQLACHAHLKISADAHSLVTDYVPVLREALTVPLIHRENDGIPDVVAKMDEYDLLKDDLEALAELAVWPGKIDPASKIQSKVKGALTRALNKEHRLLPYHIDDVAKGKKKAAFQAEVEIDEEGYLVERVDGEEEVEDEDEEKDNGSAAVIINSSSGSRGRGGGRGTRGTRGRGGRGKK